MIDYFKGDLFDSEADAFAHGCNIVGKMNAGIAKEFRERFPEMYNDFKRRCRKGVFLMGSGYLFRNSQKPHVINLATQGDGFAKLEYVDSALSWLYDSYGVLGLEKVAMPKIASGLGGLNWHEVENVINKYFYSSDLLIEIWEKD
jgi:O-acetyl-ADP-ribose deacetylase (regulator of RNase III)